ncbi:MAG TPA: hypothetical protein VLI69_04690 [Gammaproteobacteria bacterium]|nr:hypothetical protein [Gammaproteobacteria bacterium]
MPQPELVKAKAELLQNVTHLRAARKPEGARLFSGTAYLWPDVEGFGEARSNQNESYPHGRQIGR